MQTNIAAFLLFSVLAFSAINAQAQTTIVTAAPIPASRTLVIYSEGKPSGTIELPAGKIHVLSARVINVKRQNGDTMRLTGNVVLTVQQGDKILVTIKAEDAVLLPVAPVTKT